VLGLRPRSRPLPLATTKLPRWTITGAPVRVQSLCAENLTKRSAKARGETADRPTSLIFPLFEGAKLARWRKPGEVFSFHLLLSQRLAKLLHLADIIDRIHLLNVLRI
jgi:hypothetical protein